jgi:hypothetical protein
MPAELQNVEHKRGDKRQLRFGPVIDDHAHYVDLSTSTARWRLAKAPTSTGDDILLTKDTGSGGGMTIFSEVVYEQTRYTVLVDLVRADTLTLPTSPPPYRWYHACEVIDADGNHTTIADGWFDLQPSILDE